VRPTAPIAAVFVLAAIASARAAASAPSRRDLADAFGPAAAKAARVSHSAASPGLPPEAAPDAVLARARKAAAKGDLYLAICNIAALPPEGRKAMSSWKEAAQRRLAADNAAHPTQSRVP
jgi:hypothetical protein